MTMIEPPTPAELVAAWRPAPPSLRELQLREIMADGTDRVTANTILDGRLALAEYQRRAARGRIRVSAADDHHRDRL